MEQDETTRSKERHKRLSDIFAATFELEGDSRVAAQREACGGDEELLAELLALFESHDRRGAFLQTPALGTALELPNPESAAWIDANLIGATIGNCRLERVIGFGGMGTVYEAQQESPPRTVAVKIIRAEQTSRSALRRFEFEAQVLGQLSHPCIAQIYETGIYREKEDDPGRPFFVMEFIPNAMSLTHYVRTHDLAFDERLRLFAKICDAVQHGHQKGIIHRDLKPDNILVGELGQPMIIDFGVARATDSDLRRATLRTDVGQLIGTLQYMSPEQCAADTLELDTRSDVYSLGLLLYEVLCDRLPYDVSKLAIHEAVQVIREGEFRRLGQTEHSLRGDLDTITSKALDKDPERRYLTVAELGQDVRRYLGNEPILARPPSAIYQMRKFARRNRGLVGAAIAVSLSLLLGIVGTSWQAMRAEEARAAEALESEKARREAAIKTAVYEFMHETLTGFSAAEEELTVREMLDRAAVTIESAYDDDPLVEADVRDMIQAMYQTLGRHDLAEPHALRRVELLEQELGSEDEQTLHARGELAWIWQQLGRAEEGEEYLEHILDVRLAQLGDEAELTLTAKGALAMNYCFQGRLEEAEVMMREVVDDRRRLFGDGDELLIGNLNNLALIFLRSHRPEQAIEIFEDVEARHESAASGLSSDSLISTRNLADALKTAGRLPEAADKFTKVLAGRKEVLGPTHPDTLRAYYELAWVLEDTRDYTKSLEVYDEYLGVQRQRFGVPSTQVAETLHHKAACAMESGQPDVAEVAARESMVMYHELASAPPIEYRHATEVLYTILRTTGAPEERVTMLREALAYQRGNAGPGHIELNFAAFYLGFEVLHAGKPQEAMPFLREALEIAEHHWLPGSPRYWQVGDHRRLLGQALVDSGAAKEAEALLLSAHEILGEQEFTAQNQAIAREFLIRVYQQSDQPEQAKEWRSKRPKPAPQGDG